METHPNSATVKAGYGSGSGPGIVRRIIKGLGDSCLLQCSEKGESVRIALYKKVGGWQ